MNEIPFVKMHGCGNDFAIFDAREKHLEPLPEAVARLADRRRGIGFDQLLLIEPAEGAAARLRFFNADGSESGACGNGTRCAARWLADSGGAVHFRVETAGGIIECRVEGDGEVELAMPAPRLEWNEIPVGEPCNTLSLPVRIDRLPPPVGVNMGNPHAVFFVDDLEALDVARLGAVVERHPFFPERVNAGFAQRLDAARIRLRVFERGAGLTPACGSGACAALVAAVRLGLVERKARLILDGGELEIAWPGQGPVRMRGPAAYCYRGQIPRSRLVAGPSLVAS